MKGQAGPVNSSQFERWLKKQGIVVTLHHSGSHRGLKNPATGQTSILPWHGGRKQIGKGLQEQIKKDLGLK
jgi:mRNA interferase HicA